MDYRFEQLLGTVTHSGIGRGAEATWAATRLVITMLVADDVGRHLEYQ